jgi:hypothetical protein
MSVVEPANENEESNEVTDGLDHEPSVQFLELTLF